jgi:hypothetical protein
MVEPLCGSEEGVPRNLSDLVWSLGQPRQLTQFSADNPGVGRAATHAQASPVTLTVAEMQLLIFSLLSGSHPGRASVSPHWDEPVHLNARATFATGDSGEQLPARTRES